jgi:type II secretory pathway component PulC
MKKLVGLLVVMLVATSSVNAQGNWKREYNSNFTPEQQATLQVKKMTLQLNLNQSQQDAIFKLQKNQALTRQAMQKAMLERKLNGKALSSNEKFQLKSNRLDRMQQHKLAMQKILTSEQFTKWEFMAKSKFNRRNANGCQKKTRGKIIY